MGVTALAVGADSAMMTAYQMAQLLFIMLAYPLIVRRLVAWKHSPLWRSEGRFSWRRVIGTKEFEAVFIAG